MQSIKKALSGKKHIVNHFFGVSNIIIESKFYRGFELDYQTANELNALLDWVVNGMMFIVGHAAGSSGYKPFAAATSDQSVSLPLRTLRRLDNGEVREIRVAYAELNITELKKLQNELKIFDILLVYLFGISLLVLFLASVQNRGTLMYFITCIGSVLYGFGTALDGQIAVEKKKLIQLGEHICHERMSPPEHIQAILNVLRPDLKNMAGGRETNFEEIRGLVIKHGRAALNHLANIFRPEDREE